MIAKYNSNKTRFVSEDIVMLTPDQHPPPLGVDLLVLTKWGILLKGKWGDDCIEWYPLPKRANNNNGGEIAQ